MPVSRLLFLLALLPSLALAQPALDSNAHGETAVHDGDPKVAASLVLDVEEAAPGATVRAGVRFALKDGWHVYWRNPGEAGLATRVDVSVEGGDVGPLQQPFPVTFLDFNDTIQSFGWGGEVLLFQEVTLPPDASGEVVVEAKVGLLACQNICIPGELNLSRRLPIGAVTRPGSEAASFDATARRIPREAPGLSATIIHPQGSQPTAKRPFLAELSFTCEDGAACADWALANTDPVVADAPEGFESSRTERVGDLTVRIAGKLFAAAEGEATLTGVALFVDPAGNAHPIEWSAPFGSIAPAPAEVAAPIVADATGTRTDSAGAPSILLMVVFAFVGGMILNLMPCVFPVLALKVFSLLKLAGEKKGQAAKHAGAYTFGIVASLTVLALVVLGIRAAGAQVGWGFQFQEPMFVAVIAALLVVFALNLFGVFNIGSDANRLVSGVEKADGLWRSAGEGLLAVVLATPCTAPFLGTAMGFGLSAPAPVVLLLFVSLGLGLAAPFVVLVMVPGTVKLLPRPGAWMDTGKQFLGFALLGTAVWLIWVLGQLAGVNGIGRLLVFLVAVGMAAWMWGKGQLSDGRARVWQLTALILVTAVGTLFLRFPERAMAAGTESPGTELTAAETGWTPYSDEALQRALDAGRPVFVDFTADWCITCKFNENTVLSRDSVRDAFRAADTLMLKVDFTRRDDAVLQMLQAHGRAGVPLYLLYQPGVDTPQILPEMLTERIVVEALAVASSKRN